MKFNSIIRLTVVLALATTLFSCGSKKDIVYFQNIDDNSSSTSINDYSSKIKPDDMLTITVSALDQDLARPFNLTTIAYDDNGTGIGRPTQQNYLVDTNGNIDFPVLGPIKLGGLTRMQATKLIKEMLDKDYLKDPIVNIRNVNFKVTVLGEVRKPGAYTIPNERITIMEALGMAGDLTLQAQRKNVLVIRDINGKIKKYRIDLTNADVFNSPVYYLTQNDVIYVQPNKSRIKSSTVGPNTSEALRVVSILLTATALVFSITKK